MFPECSDDVLIDAVVLPELGKPTVDIAVAGAWRAMVLDEAFRMSNARKGPPPSGGAVVDDTLSTAEYALASSLLEMRSTPYTR